jgi:hypothetical protein
MNVLHVPDLGIDLISLGTLHCKGASFATAGNSFIVSFNSRPLFYATLSDSTGTLYQVQCANSLEHTALVASDGSMCLWH